MFADGSLVNSRPSNNKAWWVPILEKAYAKFNVNFSNLNGGNPGEALRELSGAPVEMYDSKKESTHDFFARIKEADERKYAMTAACIHAHEGLVPSHAYTILGVLELKAGENVLHELVKMRNPWGKEMYKGPWHDLDARWTDEFKKQAKLVADTNDGIFHLPVDDFKKAFTIYNIANI